MAMRTSLSLPCRIISNNVSHNVRPATRLVKRPLNGHGFATEASVPKKGSKGPTAMVLLNMGGPSKVSEVENFLSRLFVR